MAEDILIVGAGPTGLVFACELLTMGIPCRIIDRLAEPVSTSRSFTIHARTLELLGTLGLIDSFMAVGHPIYSMDYHFGGPSGETVGLNFGELDSLYRFCLIINQQDTEAILRAHLTSLGGVIEWNTSLRDITQTDAGRVTATLINTQTDETSVIEADWLIGCDGIGSTVRKHLHLPFDGSEYAGEMKMMDVGVTGFPGGHDRIHYYISKEHMLLFSKLPGANFRVLISDTGVGASTETARDDFQRVVDQTFGGSVTLDEPNWTTVFRIGRHKTEGYRVGHVFLAGDAAHTNSPAGGQGMNVSMQDAFNLAWKLAMVLKGQAYPELLDTYQIERQPIAGQLHEGTEFIHSIIMAHGTGLEERIALTRDPERTRKAVNRVAGINYTYRAPDADAILVAGDRAPNAMISGDYTFYQALDYAVPTLVIMLPEDTMKSEYQDAQAQMTELTAHYALAGRIVVSASIASADDHTIIDHDGTLRQAYQVGDSVLYCVIRPDQHIGVIATTPDEVVSYLDRLFVRG